MESRPIAEFVVKQGMYRALDCAVPGLGAAIQIGMATKGAYEALQKLHKCSEFQRYAAVVFERADSDRNGILGANELREFEMALMREIAGLDRRRDPEAVKKRSLMAFYLGVLEVAQNLKSESSSVALEVAGLASSLLDVEDVSSLLEGVQQLASGSEIICKGRAKVYKAVTRQMFNTAIHACAVKARGSLLSNIVSLAMNM
eukprot:m51a1_g9728 hypothetical protein (202) ;mRNA; f:1500559-1501240